MNEKSLDIISTGRGFHNTKILYNGAPLYVSEMKLSGACGGENGLWNLEVKLPITKLSLKIDDCPNLKEDWGGHINERFEYFKKLKEAIDL